MSTRATHEDSFGSATVQVVGSTLEVRNERHITRAMATRMFDTASELLRAHPFVRAVVFELTDHVGYDPGNLALGVRWFTEHREQVKRVAIVTRSHAVATLTNVGRVMCPWIESTVCSTREEALAWCAAAARSATPARGRSARSRSSDAA